MSGPLFATGRVIATPGALRVLIDEGVSPYRLLARHLTLDPGTLDVEDQKANHDALKSGARILSSYLIGTEKVWVITEAANDHGCRPATTILRPEEY